MKHLETRLAQLGNNTDKQYGAVSAPIFLSTTYGHPGMGESTGYDYTRTANPTRDVLQEGLADLEGGSHAIATSSGMSAIQLVFQAFPQGSKFIAARDLYGGSFRYFDLLEKEGQAEFLYFNEESEIDDLLSDDIAAIFIETPTNPLMITYDIKAICQKAKPYGIKVIVDNTLLTPLRQRPLDDGADIVVHSGTKFLAGHNDISAGVIVTNDPELGEKFLWLSNTTGPTLSAFDAWLFIRSLKTLKLRVDKQEENAKAIVAALEGNDHIQEVLYAGQGAMITLFLESEEKVGDFLEALEVFTYAESLGGVESLVTYPTTQTHADIPQDVRESYGLTPNLVRLSVGIETAEDLIDDLEQALKA